MFQQNNHAATMAQNELFYYHSSDRTGFFATLGSTIGDKNKIQRCYKLENLPQIVTTIDKTLDIYISQGEFYKPNRREMNLLRIEVLYVDLDTYNIPALQSLTPEQISGQILEYCRQEGVPRPSIIVYSGRGLYLKWILQNPVPGKSLPRWKAMEKELVKLFSEFGADAKVTDASRVLRIVGSINSKNGQIVRVIEPPSGESPIRYDFEYLQNELLPISREQLAKIRQRNKIAHGKSKNPTTTNINHSGKNISGLHHLSQAQLNWDRLNDLRILASMRGGVEMGMRDIFLFLATCFSCWVVKDLHNEVAVLAHEFAPSLSKTEVVGYTSTAINRALEAHASEFKKWHDSQCSDTRYKFRNQTLIDMLNIQPHEESKLTTIISKTESAERHRIRNRKENDRETYLKNSAIRKADVLSLRNNGNSIREIAATLNCSVGSVQYHLKKSSCGETIDLQVE